MIEDYLLNYGILGVWTASLLVERYRWQKSLTKAVNNLTKAIEKNI